MKIIQPTVSVLVIACQKDSHPTERELMYSRRMVNKVFLEGVEKAKRFADAFRVKGQAVIVRSNSKEQDEKGHFYREWRSFNGLPFAEVRVELECVSSDSLPVQKKTG